MSPSKRAISIPRAALAAAIVGANAWTAGVVAHPIAVARGVAVIGGSRVRITLQEAGESLIHEMPAAHASSDWSASEIQRAFARRAGNMVRRLEVRDESGRLLAGRLTQARLESALADAADPTSSRSEERVQRDQRVAAFSPPAADRVSAYAWGGVRALYELEYVAERTLEHVTFRQAPPEDDIIPTQLALRIREQSSEAERFVRLTSAGNPETLDLSLPPSPVELLKPACEPARTPAVDVPASMQRHRFKCIQAVVRREPDRVLVEAYLPLALLETWRPLNRKQADFVTPAEQRAACDAAVRLLRATISLTGTSPGAEANRPAVLSSVVLGPDQAYLNDGATRRGDRALGAWSARVAVRLEFAVPPTESEFTFAWRLFNPAVLTADVLIINGPIASDGSEAREHQVTTYNPTIVLNMPVARSRP